METKISLILFLVAFLVGSQLGRFAFMLFGPRK